MSAASLPILSPAKPLSVEEASEAPVPTAKPPIRDGETRIEYMRRMEAEGYILPRRKRTHFSQLPQWVKLAIAEQVMEGLTTKQVVEKRKLSSSVYNEWKLSPAGKAWRDALRKRRDDPSFVAETLLKQSVSGVAINYLAALDTAIEKQDYREVGVMSRDILDRMGITKKAPEASKPTIVINLGADVSLEGEYIDASYEVVESADG